MQNTKELRAFLIERMQKTASGDEPVASAKAICNYAQQVYNTLNLEVKYANVRSKLGEGVVISAVDFGDGPSV